MREGITVEVSVADRARLEWKAERLAAAVQA
jgi:hypothetical protein